MLATILNTWFPGILYYILFYRRIWVWYSPYWSSGTAPIWRISHKDPPVKEYIEFVLLCMWYSYSQRGWISLREEYFIFREEYFISREVYLNHSFEVHLSRNEVLLSEWYSSSLRGWISHAQEYKKPYPTRASPSWDMFFKFHCYPQKIYPYPTR